MEDADIGVIETGSTKDADEVLKKFIDKVSL